MKPFNLPEPKAVCEVELLSKILYLKGPSSSYYEQFFSVVNAIIFNLYFPDYMKERGIDVLEFVERDIDEVMKGREFEKLSDAEKDQVIKALHAKWSHPGNEVVKRMAMFKEKSPEILKLIMES